VSGHLDKEGIKYVVKEIDAKRVFPVHTQDPEGFKKFSKNVEIAEKEKERSAQEISPHGP